MLAAALALLTLASHARQSAAKSLEPAVVLPTSVESAPAEYGPPSASNDDRATRLAALLDDTVREGVEDLGLEPVTGAPVPTDAALAATAPATWVFAPRLALAPSGVRVRLVALAPHSRVELVREELFTAKTLGKLVVHTVVMLRDLVEAGRGSRRAPPPRESRPRFEAPEAPPSSGRSVLALNTAVLGGYVGFTIQKASGSADVRLVYPLVALGTGLGLGASLLVADEWNITTGDAWYLAAGMWWPGASGILLAEGFGAKPDDRYLYGLLGAGAGLALGGAAIATHPVSEGGAVLAHSGGAFGALLGAMTDAAIQGETGGSVVRGVGFGTAVGVLAGGAMATKFDISPSRALFVDLSASLGALGGAALASPLLLVDESNPERTRLWLASSALGTIAGGIVGWYATTPPPDAPAPRRGNVRVLPYAGASPSGTGLCVGAVGEF